VEHYRAGITLEKLQSRHNGNINSHSDLRDRNASTEFLAVSSLLPADSPRLDGEDADHIRMLASIDSKLPPILVHRPTMRIIDGMHRLRAAVLRGDEMIEVRFFDGPDAEVFVLAVKANIAHGRPLTMADRTAAAERIMVSHPPWSDRAIAAAAGLGARTVAEVRVRLAGSANGEDEIKARIGRDGRIRPLDYSEGRLKASEIIWGNPEASVREIARGAGVSPATALDVRKRMQRGDHPVPSARKSRRHDNEQRALRSKTDALATERDVAVMLRGLKNDPSLRFSESGRAILRWMFAKAIVSGEWHGYFEEVPTHCAYVLARIARQCADQWLLVADDLARATTEGDEMPLASDISDAACRRA
jgi:ParB-like chromosome segregation protein Spo0J